MPDVAEAPARSAALIKAARRITVKVGSSLLVGRRWCAAGIGSTLSARTSATLREEGKSVRSIVSSGAVALGRRRADTRSFRAAGAKQAAAPSGQPLLMQAWEAAAAPFGIPTAQLLLTFDDTESRRRWLNARATIEVLLASGALPVVNENDSVATDELRYGDNDRLSARVAQMIQADLLLLLSDVDGLYTADPARDSEARHVPHIDSRSPRKFASWAAGASGAGLGSGGMRTKLAAARIAQRLRLRDDHRRPAAKTHPLARLAIGRSDATLVAAAGSPARAYKQWIAGTLDPGGQRPRRRRRGARAGSRQEPASRRHRLGRGRVRARRLPPHPRSRRTRARARDQRL